MASTPDESKKPAARKPVTPRPAAQTPPSPKPSAKPGAAAASAKPVGKQAQAEARVAVEAAKKAAAAAAATGARPLTPLAIVLLGIRWIDRWEPEPRSGLIFAFLWGAGVSVLIALVVDFGVSEQIAAGGGATNGTIFAQTVFQAPVVEEFGKGLGVLLIFIVGRRFFDGPVDGIVYAA